MVCMDSQKAECKVFLKSDHKIKEKGRFEILKDLPKPGDYVLLTVAKGSAAGEKAILAEKKIIWESKENGFFSAHFSEA